VEEEIVDALGNASNASMPEQVNQPKPWRKIIIIIIIIIISRKMPTTVKLPEYGL
jgi:hypothetical protein